MKFKKIMLITLLLLAVLTIGAVSASQDADALAVDDVGDETIVEAPVDEDALEAESDDVLSMQSINNDDIAADSLNPEDFNVTFPTTEFDMEIDDPAVITYFTPEGISQYSSCIVVYYGEEEFDRTTFDMYLDDVGTYQNLTLSEILYDMDPGVYNLTVFYTDDFENYMELGKTTVNVTSSHVYTADEFIFIYSYVADEIDEDYLAEIYDEEIHGLDGVVTAYANGAKIYTKTYSKYNRGGPIHISNLTGSFDGEYTIMIEYKRTDGKVFNVSREVYFNNVVGKSPIKTAITVSPTSVSMAYGANKELTITLKDADNNPIKDQYVKISVMGISYDMKTDANGKFKMSLSTLPPATHNIKFEFKDVAPYEGTEKTVTVKITKATPKLTAKAKTFKKSTKTKKYTVTLKTNLNKVMKNTLVTLKVNKKTFKAKTNSKGQAIFKITNLKKKGTFKATVTYKGDSYYNKVIKKNVKIIVK